MNRSEVLDSFQFGASDACTSVENYALKGSAMKKLSYLFVLFALIILSASTTKADVADPLIGAGGGGSCATVDLMSANQAFTVTAAELYPVPCVIDIVNDTGGDLTSFVVTVDTAFSFALNCYIDTSQAASPFSLATTTAPNACTFSDGVLGTGKILGLLFGTADGSHPFCLVDPTTGVCNNFQNGLPVTLHATPEPASFALIGTGLAALVARRKKLGSRPLLPNGVC
jgi:PEP-CTERM motif-containing protein